MISVKSGAAHITKHTRDNLHGFRKHFPRVCNSYLRFEAISRIVLERLNSRAKEK
jgi:hypothetical protein